ACAEPVQILVGEPGRLADALRIHQAEAALERRRGRAWLLEQVAEGPVAHALRQTFRRLELAEDVRGADVRVVHGITWRIAGAPFGEIQRQAGHGGLLDLLAHATHVTDDRIR